MEHTSELYYHWGFWTEPPNNAGGVLLKLTSNVLQTQVLFARGLLDISTYVLIDLHMKYTITIYLFITCIFYVHSLLVKSFINANLQEFDLF